MCWESIYDLFTGRYTFEAVSGPVGISSAIGDAAAHGVASLFNIAALISINLGVMNLLPIPALDGGRIVGVLITTAVEGITRKKIDPKYEGYLHGAGMIFLLGLMALVMFKDIFVLFRG
jgi:regulator of sigma E protease